MVTGAMAGCQGPGDGRDQSGRPARRLARSRTSDRRSNMNMADGTRAVRGSMMGVDGVRRAVVD